MGQYLVDSIYPPWVTSVKAIPAPLDTISTTYTTRAATLFAGSFDTFMRLCLLQLEVFCCGQDISVVSNKLKLRLLSGSKWPVACKNYFRLLFYFTTQIKERSRHSCSLLCFNCDNGKNRLLLIG
ncbi:hypothetical protein BX666DRAFT_1046872 [Dichotomocladium elegans]|nr:hypothetical protein BX666DRAFT_1046872 [Dichotomocladium elegans]